VRVALRIAYDGTLFHGSARQPGLRTVEGETEYALQKIGAIADLASSRFMFASRTDAGVSALGNVVAIDTAFPPSGIVGAFNSVARDVTATGYAEVGPDFDPRHALYRTYRYQLSGKHDLEGLRRHAALFVGVHDFRSFSREAEESVRSIDQIIVRPRGEFTAIEVQAQGFLWNMVRRIVAALLALEQGTATETEVVEALQGTRTVDLGAAPPEPLVLVEVDHGIEYSGGLEKATRDVLQRRRESSLLRLDWFDEVLRKGE